MTITKIDPVMIAQDGATDGQVMTYSTTNGQWEPQTAAGGGGAGKFELITSQAIAAGATQDVNFSTSGYSAIRVVMNEIVPNTINGTGSLNVRVKDNGTTITSSTYFGGGTYFESSATPLYNFITSAIRISSTTIYGTSSFRHSAILDFTWDGSDVMWYANWVGLKSGAGAAYGVANGRISITTAFDGVQLWSPDTNLTANGTIYVYGMKNS